MDYKISTFPVSELNRSKNLFLVAKQLIEGLKRVPSQLGVQCTLDSHEDAVKVQRYLHKLVYDCKTPKVTTRIAKNTIRVAYTDTL